jgi:hypothetical protein
VKSASNKDKGTTTNNNTSGDNTQPKETSSSSSSSSHLAKGCESGRSCQGPNTNGKSLCCSDGFVTGALFGIALAATVSFMHSRAAK